IVIYLEPTDDGIITVTLHEELIKPFEDGTFVVIVDNQEMQSPQVASCISLSPLYDILLISNFSTLIIPRGTK
ncbi:hypothetical protein N9545_10250, partial [Salibacteraceae bacterium]|nr:hypothetical protein [Salibacteraceae bacterium]